MNSSSQRRIEERGASRANDRAAAINANRHGTPDRSLARDTHSSTVTQPPRVELTSLRSLDSTSQLGLAAYIFLVARIDNPRLRKTLLSTGVILAFLASCVRLSTPNASPVPTLPRSGVTVIAPPTADFSPTGQIPATVTQEATAIGGPAQSCDIALRQILLGKAPESGGYHIPTSGYSVNFTQLRIGLNDEGYGILRDSVGDIESFQENIASNYPGARIVKIWVTAREGWVAEVVDAQGKSVWAVAADGVTAKYRPDVPDHAAGDTLNQIPPSPDGTEERVVVFGGCAVRGAFLPGTDTMSSWFNPSTWLWESLAPADLATSTPEAANLDQVLADWNSGKTILKDEDRFTFPSGPGNLGFINVEPPDPNKRSYLYHGLLLGTDTIDNHTIAYVGFEDVDGNRFFVPFNFGDLDGTGYRQLTINIRKTLAGSNSDAVRLITNKEMAAALSTRVGTTILLDTALTAVGWNHRVVGDNFNEIEPQLQTAYELALFLYQARHASIETLQKPATVNFLPNLFDSNAIPRTGLVITYIP